MACGAQAREGRGTLGQRTPNPPFLPMNPNFPQSLGFVPSWATHSSGHTPSSQRSGLGVPATLTLVCAGGEAPGELRGYCSSKGKHQLPLEPTYPLPRSLAVAEDAAKASGEGLDCAGAPPLRVPSPPRQSDCSFSIFSSTRTQPLPTTPYFTGEIGGAGSSPRSPSPPGHTVLRASPQLEPLIGSRIPRRLGGTKVGAAGYAALGLCIRSVRSEEE